MSDTFGCRNVIVAPATSVELRLPRPLCAAMATQFAVGGAVIPFASLWFQDQGLDFTRISLIYVASSATLMVFPFLWGMLADRHIPLNRLFALLNLGAAGALAFLSAQTGFAGMLVGFTLLTALLNPTFMLINALSFHHLPRPHEQFGRLRGWGSLGWTLPFLPISLWLACRSQPSLGFTLHLGTLCCLIMVAVTFWLPHTEPAGRRQGPGRRHHPYGPALRSLLSDSNYVVLLVAYFCMAGSFSILTYYSFPLLEKVGVPRVWLGPAQAAGVLFEFALFQWQPALLRRWNYSGVILAGCAALLARQLLYAVSDNLWLLCLSYTLAGAVVVFNIVGTSLLVNAIAGSAVRSTAQTLLVLVGSGFGPIVANWAAGRIAAHSGGSLRPVFVFASALAAAAALLIAARVRRLDEAGRRPH